MLVQVLVLSGLMNRYQMHQPVLGINFKSSRKVSQTKLSVTKLRKLPNLEVLAKGYSRKSLSKNLNVYCRYLSLKNKKFIKSLNMPFEICLKPLEPTPENLSVKSSEPINSWNSLANLLPNQQKRIYIHIYTFEKWGATSFLEQITGIPQA